MIKLPEDRRVPLTPQLALRVAILGSFALAMFAVIFFRLWFLQVLSGDQYLAQAQTNQVREISIPAPRGKILDRNGTVLVDSTQSNAIQILPDSLPVPVQRPSQYLYPPRADAIVYRRLAYVLGMPTQRVKCPIPGHGVHRLAPISCAVAKQLAQLSYSTVTLTQDASRDVQFYLAERQNLFPGVQVQQVYLRDYPHKELAAQLFGTVGRITGPEVKRKHNGIITAPRRLRGVSINDVVGQSGLEYSYDQWLRGVDGANKVQVNSLGQFSRTLAKQEPVIGHNLKLSLDVNLQRVAQAALQQSIDSNYPADAGSFVAMNPQDGEIYAMGSLPSFDPNVFAHPISVARYNQLFGPQAGSPQLNRVIDSAGATGSTFKPITATAALQSGVWSVGDTFDDTGQFCEGGGLCRHNAGGGANGVLDLVKAIQVSSDVFFYNLGARLNSDAPNGGALQQWAHRYGIGRKTGVDLPGELTGTLPDAKWRADRNKLEADCDRLTHPTRTFPSHPNHSLPPGGCGIADGTDRPWSEGDNVNLAVGQGDVQVTPLQLAVAYSALANGGTVVRPHVGFDVQSADGTVITNVNPPPARHIPIDPTYRATILAGLRAAASQPGGTSADVFGNFPEKVYGKTGTAQYNNQQDYAWYACFVPGSATSKPITVVVKVEQGGFGAVAAAPVAREILSQWFFGNPGKYTAGGSKTL